MIIPIPNLVGSPKIDSQSSATMETHNINHVDLRDGVKTLLHTSIPLPHYHNIIMWNLKFSLRPATFVLL